MIEVHRGIPYEARYGTTGTHRVCYIEMPELPSIKENANAAAVAAEIFRDCRCARVVSRVSHQVYPTSCLPSVSRAFPALSIMPNPNREMLELGGLGVEELRV